MGWGIPGGTSLFVLLNASCHKKHECIWFMGGDLNGKSTELFYTLNRVVGGWGGGMAGTPGRGIFPSVLLNASYHKKGEYICLKGGIWTVSEILSLLCSKGSGACRARSRRPPGQCYWMCLIIWNMNIYGLWVGIWTILEILSLLCSKGGGTCPGTQQETPWSVLFNVSYHIKHEYIGFMGGDLNHFILSDIKPFMKWMGWGLHLIIRNMKIYGLGVGNSMVTFRIGWAWACLWVSPQGQPLSQGF